MTIREQIEKSSPPAPPTLEQLHKVLPTVSDWDTAGSVLFESMRLADRLEPDATSALIHAAENCCQRLLSTLGMNNIAPEVLMLPVSVEVHSHHKPQRKKWAEYLRILNDTIHQKEVSWSDDVIVVLVFLDGMADSTIVSTDRLVRRLTRIEQLNDKATVNLSKLGTRLVNAGWLQSRHPDFEITMGRLDKRLRELGPSTAFVVLTNVLDVLNLRDATVWVSKCIAENVIFPFLDRMPVLRESVDYGLWIELTIFTLYLKKVDTREHFESTYQRLRPALLTYGDILRSEDQRSFNTVPCEQPRIGFLFQSHAYLAHAQNYIYFLEGLSDLDTVPIKPIAYIIGNEEEHGQEPFPLRLRELGSELSWIDRPASKLGTFIISLKSRVIEDDVAALVFISLPSFLLTCARFRVAPSVIWWAMKYHQVYSDDVDGYLTYGVYETERVIDGRKWRSVPAALSSLYDHDVEEMAINIRKQYLAKGYDFILSCIGREEKINHRAYLETLKAILDTNPSTTFLWSGRAIPFEVKNMMSDLGITDQCHHIGWVQTKVYAQVTDLYLDSFPFASGHTAYEAMAAAKPLVVLKTPESIESSTATALLPFLERTVGSREEQDEIIQVFSKSGDDLQYAPFVETIEDYIEKAQRLINDPNFRKKSGEAGRVYIEKYLGNTGRMAKGVCDHLIDIVSNTHEE